MDRKSAHLTLHKSHYPKCWKNWLDGGCRYGLERGRSGYCVRVMQLTFTYIDIGIRHGVNSYVGAGGKVHKGKAG